jgi:hypothetical protein
MRSSKIQIFSPLLFAVFLVAGSAFAGLSSYIDGHNRFILDGEPFFPLGVFVVQDLTSTSQLDEIANSPFDTVMNYNINNGSDSKITYYLNQLDSRNLKLIFALNEYVGHGEKDINAITHKVNTFGNHPAIISWYMNDELGPDHLEELKARYQKVRELDKNHPVWSVHWNTDWLMAEAHTTDIVGVDPYPIGNHPITLVSQMADAAKRTGKPLWLVPQIFDWRDYPGDFRAKTGRPPTKDEMRAMTYLAINHGAKGLIYYSYFNIRDDKDYRGRWRQIREIADEVKSLKPVLLSTQQTNDNDIICNNDSIDFKLLRQGDTYYLFAVNTENRAMSSVSFGNKLPNRPVTVSVLFENNRRIVATPFSFVDSFGPYEVHVYQWKP